MSSLKYPLSLPNNQYHHSTNSSHHWQIDIPVMTKFLAVGDVDSAICILSAAGEHDLSYAVIDPPSYICATCIKATSGNVYVIVTADLKELHDINVPEWSSLFILFMGLITHTFLHSLSTLHTGVTLHGL